MDSIRHLHSAFLLPVIIYNVRVNQYITKFAIYDQGLCCNIIFLKNFKYKYIHLNYWGLKIVIILLYYIISIQNYLLYMLTFFLILKITKVLIKILIINFLYYLLVH